MSEQNVPEVQAPKKPAAPSFEELARRYAEYQAAHPQPKPEQPAVETAAVDNVVAAPVSIDAVPANTADKPVQVEKSQEIKSHEEKSPVVQVAPAAVVKPIVTAESAPVQPVKTVSVEIQAAKPVVSDQQADAEIESIDEQLEKQAREFLRLKELKAQAIQQAKSQSKVETPVVEVKTPQPEAVQGPFVKVPGVENLVIKPQAQVQETQPEIPVPVVQTTTPVQKTEAEVPVKAPATPVAQAEPAQETLNVAPKAETVQSVGVPDGVSGAAENPQAGKGKASGVFKALVEDSKALFKSPIKTMRSMRERKAQASGFAMLGIYALAVAFFEFCVVKSATNLLGGIFLSLASSSLTTALLTDGFGIFAGILLVILAVKAVGICFAKLGDKLFGGNASYQDIVVNEGAVSMLRVVPLLLSGIGLLLNAYVGMAFYAISFFAGTVYAYKAFDDGSKVDEEKTGLSFILWRAARAVVAGLLVYLFFIK